ncbi:MAG: PQQ-binding-like beta-propeller repeat protein, partial [Terracidiphilus sp.]
NGYFPNAQDGFAPRRSGRAWKLCCAALFAAAAACLVIPAQAGEKDWATSGFDKTNTAHNPLEATIGPGNVAQLTPKWTFTTGGDVSARPAVANNIVYFPDWGGNLWAVDATSGAEIWGKQLSTYIGSVSQVNARATPTISNGVLFIGLQTGAWFLAIDAANGKLIWKKQLNTVDPYAIVTTAALVKDDVVYTGTASTQEANISGAPGTAMGSVVALDRWTGAILWHYYTTVQGYTGADVWGNSPVVDDKRGLLYIGTGDNFNTPTDPAYLACNPGATAELAAVCQSPHNHVDSVLAIDIYTGKLKWSYRAQTWNQQDTEGVQNGSDFFNLSCLYGIGTCPTPTGPDYDFGQGPSEITYSTKHGTKTIIGIGQKSGIYYAFDPDNGNLLWATQVGPGSSLGGMEWGSASDGKRIYVAITNYYGIPVPGVGSAGFWAALDPETGAILWRTADPNGAVDLGPLTVANGVVYVPSTGQENTVAGGTGNAATAPTMLALDAATGKVLWNFASGSSTIAGAAVSDGSVYWGTGYTHLGVPGITGGNNTFYAFKIGAK